MSDKSKKCKGGSVPGIVSCDEEIFIKGMCKKHYDEYKADMEKQEEKARQKIEEKKQQEEEYKLLREKYRNDEGPNKLGYPVMAENGGISAWETKGEITDRLATYFFISMNTMNGFSLVQRDGDTICIFDKEKGIWNTDDDSVRRAISMSSIKIHQLEYNKEKDIWVRGKNYKNYSENLVGVNKIMEYLRIVLEDTQFIEKNIETNTGKILFRNGIYYFDEDKFEEEFDPEIVFFHRIDRDYPTRNEDDIAWVKNILFDNLFDNLELSRYIQSMIARSIYGDYRIRKSLFCRGETASGKGMITEALCKSFPGLVNSFDANNLLFSKSTKDEAQKNMWLIPFKTSRLLISNEMTIEVGDDGRMKKFFDSNSFKKIVSGGDEIDVRGMNENIRKMVNRSNLFFMAQDFPEFMPKCGAVLDRKEDILFPKSFVLDPKHPNQFKRDTTIKDKFKQAKYQDALFFVISDSYKNDVKGKDYFKPTHTAEFEEIIEETEQAETLQSVLEQKYDFVQGEIVDAKDFVHSDELNAYIISKLGFSEKRIGLEFKKLAGVLGYKFESKVDNTKKKRYRTNIKKKPLI